VRELRFGPRGQIQLATVIEIGAGAILVAATAASHVLQHPSLGRFGLTESTRGGKRSRQRLAEAGAAPSRRAGGLRVADRGAAVATWGSGQVAGSRARLLAMPCGEHAGGCKRAGDPVLLRTPENVPVVEAAARRADSG
jgi:hypothetical protein